MQSVVQRPVSIPDPARPRPSPPPWWAPTVRLGVAVSIVAALVAVVVHLVTPLPTVVIVALLAAGAFAVSWHATTVRRRRL